MFDILEIRKETVRVGLCRYTSIARQQMHKMYLTVRVKQDGEEIIVTTPQDLFIQKSLHYKIVQAVAEAWKEKFFNII